MYYNFVRLHQTLKITPAMAAGVTDRLWEMGDIVSVIEAWEISEARTAKLIDENKIGEGPFVRVTFPNGEFETIYGFATKADAMTHHPVLDSRTNNELCSRFVHGGNHGQSRHPGSRRAHVTRSVRRNDRHLVVSVEAACSGQTPSPPEGARRRGWPSLVDGR